MISNIKESIEKLKSENSSIIYSINNLNMYINNNRPSGLSSKQKRKFKEERQLILNSNSKDTNVWAQQLNYNIDKVEKLQKDLTGKEKDLAYFVKELGSNK